MKSLLSLMLLTSCFLLVTEIAMADQPICFSIKECNKAIEQARLRISELLENSEQRTSNMGINFIRDTSNPDLGQAYRDPSGLIWGAIVTKLGGAPQLMSQGEASDFCKRNNARLPSKEEYLQLAKNLGRDSKPSLFNQLNHQGYSPLTVDEKKQVFPGITNRFWSQVDRDHSEGVQTFNGTSGSLMYEGNNGVPHLAVRCVSN